MTISPRLARRDTSYVSLDPSQVAIRQKILDHYANGAYADEPVDCFCGASGGQLIAGTDRYGLSVRTVLCPACGLLRTSPRMNADTVTHFYTEHYRSLYTNAGAGVLFETQHHKGQQFAQVLSKLGENLLVYEVGCGCGGALKAFQEAGHTVAGCDFDKEYLAYGRSQGLTLVEGGADTLLKQQGQRADVVLLTHVAEHFLDLRHEFALVKDVLAPGGFLLAEVPGVRSITTDYRGDILLYLQNAHTYHFTAATFRYVLESVGFEVLAADEQVIALARRPEEDAPKVAPAPPQEESSAILSYLREVETQWQAANP